MKKTLQYGFTLIELLIVIAVLGILATIVLAAINPIEQLARGRDAGRISTVTQIGHAWTNYATAQNLTTYPPVPITGGWESTLVTAKELSQVIFAPSSGSTACGSGNNEQDSSATGGLAGQSICYATFQPTNGVTDGGAVVWEILESQNSRTRYKTASGSVCTATGTVVAVVYSTSQGKSGIQCLAASTSVPDGNATLY